jgi:predicted DNA-binding ribbon-helix-helix protein
MCGLFIEANDSLWSSSTKSVRIEGVVTSIRLESFFWMTLEEISARDDLSVAQLLTKLYLEAIDADHDLGNFTSFLRVCCSRYLSLIADGRIIRGASMPLADIEATPMLNLEKADMLKRQQALPLRQVNNGTVN